MKWRPLIPKGGGLIQMDVGDLPSIPTGSFWWFSSLVVFFLVFGSLTYGAILRP
jgi:hypothetical protein